MDGGEEFRGVQACLNASSASAASTSHPTPCWCAGPTGSATRSTGASTATKAPLSATPHGSLARSPSRSAAARSSTTRRPSRRSPHAWAAGISGATAIPASPATATRCCGWPTQPALLAPAPQPRPEATPAPELVGGGAWRDPGGYPGREGRRPGRIGRAGPSMRRDFP